MLHCKDSAEHTSENKGTPPTTKKAVEGVMKLEHIAPVHWWAGMKNPELELILHQKNIADYTISLTASDIQIKKISKTENPNYQFLLLDIGKAKPQKFNILFTKGKEVLAYPYELKLRQEAKNRIQGVTTKDIIYLLMPDRFANGDYTNDSLKTMHETIANRDTAKFRHGGDIQGIIDHLDYFKELGVTALWLNPVLENNQPKESYHGYAATDHYKIDARLGTHEKYLELVNKAHEKGIKIIMDIIHNHIGNKHWLYEDSPSKDFYHQFDKFTRTTYRDQTLMDPYSADIDKNTMRNGWFDTHMPDLNQSNPFVAKYLTQNNIWWVEESGLDCFRIDTYAYPDFSFMNAWCTALMTEYPQLTMFGETWVHGILNQAFFVKNNLKNSSSTLQGVTDFQLYYAINDALTKPQGWTDGVTRIYSTLANDFIYENPMRNIVFLDNHDLSRFYSVAGENMDKFKSGISWLLTVRGIPCLYYGTEVLMKNFADLSGVQAREDFVGGWKNDKTNKFKQEGRNEKEKEAFEFVKKIMNYRNATPALQTGKLTQFVPNDGVYTYFRYDEKTTVMVVMNTSDKKQKLGTARFAERLNTARSAKNIFTNEVQTPIDTLLLNPLETKILEIGQ